MMFSTQRRLHRFKQVPSGLQNAPGRLESVDEIAVATLSLLILFFLYSLYRNDLQFGFRISHRLHPWLRPFLDTDSTEISMHLKIFFLRGWN